MMGRHVFVVVIHSLLILFGIVVLCLAIVRGRRLLVPLRKLALHERWYLLLRLMIFFVVGYATVLGLVVAGRIDLLSGVTVPIFAAGALFVLVSVNASVAVTRALLRHIAALERAEQDLREREGQFHTFFDVADVGFSQVDPMTDKYRVVNAKMEAITGYRSDELCRLTFSDITHPDDRERDRAGYRDLIEGRRSTYSIEKRYVRKDGGIVWVAVHAVASRDRAGRMGAVALVQDITERKRGEAERDRLLRDTQCRQELLETLIKNAPVAIALVSAPNMLLELANPRAFAMASFDLSVGKSIFEHMPPAMAEEARAKYARLLAGESVVDHDRLIPRRLPDGTYEDRYYTVARMRVRLPDERVGVLILAEDITQQISRRRELEKRVGERTAELRQAYAFVNAVVENIPDAVFVKEAKQLRVTHVNRSWQELFGFTYDEIVGKSDYDLFPKAEADCFTANDRKVLAAGKCLETLEEAAHTQARGERILHTKKVPICDESGRPQYLLGIAEDITDRRQAEEVRQKLTLERIAHAESERALRLRDEFISIAAHELKTPLTALRMQIQLLTRLLPEIESTKAPALLSLIGGSQVHLDRFAKLVADLLDVSRFSAGTLSIERSEMDLSELVRRVAQRYEGELSRCRCSLALHLPGDVVGLWDPSRIEQVLINLLSNAVKYGAGKPIEISVEDRAETVTLAVRDHGIGIATEDQKRIFARFERAVSMKTFGGFGLGLFISNQIVKAHGGALRVESEPGKGACFIVELARWNRGRS
jgi:PAS domain S-box-containing protein